MPHQQIILKTAVLSLLITVLLICSPAKSQAQETREEKLASADAAFNKAFGLFRQNTLEAYISALEKFQRAEKIYKEVDGKNANIGVSWLVSGLISNNIGKKNDALTFYDKALKFFRDIENKELEATTLNNIGLVYFSLNEQEKALESYNLAAPIFSRLGNKRGEATTLNNIGLVYDASGEKQKAIEHYNLALPIYQKAEDKNGEAATLNNLGKVYNDLGEKRKALEYYDLALPIFKKIEDKGGEAKTLNNMSAVYSELGEKKNALDKLHQALPLYKQIGDKNGEAAAFNNLGKIYNDLDDKQKALEFYNLALPLMKEIGDKGGEAAALNNIGLLYDDLGEKRKASEYYNSALPLYIQAGNKSGEASALNNIGAVYFKSAEYGKALEFYNNALPIFRQIGDKSGEAGTIHNIAFVHEKTGEMQKALEFYNLALTLRKQSGDLNGEATTLNNMMYVWNTLKNHRLAIFYGKQSVNKFQELRRNIKGLEKETQKTYLKSVENVYRHLAGLLSERGFIAEAEQVLAMLKEEEYFSYLRRDDKVAADFNKRIEFLPDEKKAFEEYEEFTDEITQSAREFEELKNKIPVGKTFESLTEDEQIKYKNLEIKYNKAVARFNNFIDKLKIKFSQNTEKAQLITQAKSLTQSILREANEPHTVIISTIVGEDRLNLIVTTTDVQTAHTVDISTESLEKLVTEYRRALTNPEVDPRPLGKELYDALFPAKLKKDLQNIGANTIAWSLDGILRYVPMATLWDGERYLVERYNQAVINLASLNKLTSGVDRKNWKAFAVGVSKSFENFDELPAVPKELCSVVSDPDKRDYCKKYGEKGIYEGVMLRDEEFTYDRFQPSFGKLPLVHVASHFTLNASDYKNSYLLLGGGTNRRFSLSNLETARLDGVELLTLSACNTALNSDNDSNGLEVEGFSAFAQKQGVKSVLATLWAVADDSTSRLMIEFYTNLEDKPQIGKAEALRLAQVFLLNGKYQANKMPSSEKRTGIYETGSENRKLPKFAPSADAPYAHPFYWSPFVLIGNWK